MSDEIFLLKYEELLDKDYCNCNEMNCIDNNSPRRILNIAKKLHQENQELKKQLEEKRNKVREYSYKLANFRCEETYENQQKEFIDWLENEINNCENVIAGVQEKSYYHDNDDLKEELTEKSQKSYQKRILLEEVFERFKEIIGGSNE